jgi:hypothetical protein
VHLWRVSFKSTAYVKSYFNVSSFFFLCESPNDYSLLPNSIDGGSPVYPCLKIHLVLEIGNSSGRYATEINQPFSDNTARPAAKFETIEVSIGDSPWKNQTVFVVSINVL